jgi:hypothetical protein
MTHESRMAESRANRDQAYAAIEAADAKGWAERFTILEA